MVRLLIRYELKIVICENNFEIILICQLFCYGGFGVWGLRLYNEFLGVLR